MDYQVMSESSRAAGSEVWRPSVVLVWGKTEGIRVKAVTDDFTVAEQERTAQVNSAKARGWTDGQVWAYLADAAGDGYTMFRSRAETRSGDNISEVLNREVSALSG